MAPPPCRGLPGTVCHMVIVTVNNLDFFGFGPSASLARHYAEEDAYKGLISESQNTVTENSQSLNGEQVPVKHEPDNLIEEPYDLSQDSDDDLMLSNSQTVGMDTSDDTSRFMDTDLSEASVATGETCAMPHESAREQPPESNLNSVPKTLEEFNTVLETPPPVYHSPNRVTWEHRPSGHRNIVDTLFSVARRKRVKVTFTFDNSTGSRKGGSVVIARVCGGGFTAEGRHFRKNMAKCEAAAKLLEVLSRLPDKTPPHPPPHVRQCPPRFERSSDGGNHLNDCQQSYQLWTQESITHQDESGMQQDQPVKSSLAVSTAPSPVESVASDKSNSMISSNPIGQLTELLAKQQLQEPTYNFGTVITGVFSEFRCTVSARGLSANGIGSSKKLAKRHAAENLLSMMASKNINIDVNSYSASSVKKKVEPLVMSGSKPSTSCAPTSLHHKKLLNSPPKAPLLSLPSQHQLPSPHNQSRPPLLNQPPAVNYVQPHPPNNDLPPPPHVSQHSSHLEHPSPPQFNHYPPTHQYPSDHHPPPRCDWPLPLPFGPPPLYPQPSQSHVNTPRPNRDLLPRPRQPILATPPHPPPLNTHSLPPPTPHPHSALMPPSHPFSLPPPTPHSRWAPHLYKRRLRITSSESESDSGCERISSGLREVIPQSCSNRTEDTEPGLAKKLQEMSVECVDQSDAQAQASETRPQRMPAEVKYQHQPIKMRGVHISTRSNPSQDTLVECRNENSQSCPDSKGGEDKVESDCVFVSACPSDPLQFVTRLPQKRHKSWSTCPRRDQSIFSKLRRKKSESYLTKSFTQSAMKTSSPQFTRTKNDYIPEDSSLPKAMLMPVEFSRGCEELASKDCIEESKSNSAKHGSPNDKDTCGDSGISTLSPPEAHTCTSLDETTHLVNDTAAPVRVDKTPGASVRNAGDSSGGTRPRKNVLATPPTELPTHPLLAFAQSIEVNVSPPNSTSIKTHSSLIMHEPSSLNGAFSETSSSSKALLCRSPSGGADKSQSVSVK